MSLRILAVSLKSIRHWFAPLPMHYQIQSLFVFVTFTQKQSIERLCLQENFGCHQKDISSHHRPQLRHDCNLSRHLSVLSIFYFLLIFFFTIRYCSFFFFLCKRRIRTTKNQRQKSGAIQYLPHLICKRFLIWFSCRSSCHRIRRWFSAAQNRLQSDLRVPAACLATTTTRSRQYRSSSRFASRMSTMRCRKRTPK